MHHVPWLVKGLTLPQRAGRLRELFGTYPAGWWIEVDFERFDAHVDLLILVEIEIALYMAILNHPDFKQYMEMELKTTAYHMAGLIYWHIGRRRSGDPNTSIGNGDINRFFHWLAWKTRHDWASSHEGDDGIGLVRCQDPTWHVNRLEAVADLLGFVIKVVVSREPWQTVFCGRVNVIGPLGYDNMADLPRAMNKFHITLANLPPQPAARKDSLRALLLGKAMSYYVTDRDTPVLGYLCWAIIRLFRRLKPRYEDKWRASMLGDLQKVDFSVEPRPSTEFRVAVSQRYNLTLCRQEALEAEYKSWVTLGFIPRDPLLLVCEGASEMLVDTPAYYIEYYDA